MRYLLFLLYLLLFGSLTFSSAHGQNTLKVVGTIYDEDGMLKNAIIEIIKDSVIVDDYRSNHEGRFSFELDFNRTFLVNFKNTGYSSKKIKINTYLPEGKDPLTHQLISMELELIKKYGASNDRGILGEVKFSRVTKEFSYESRYDANAFLNIQVTGIDYYLSSRGRDILDEEEIELLDFDFIEEDRELRKADFYDYVINERNKFLGEKKDSIEFENLPIEDNKIALDTIINQYTRHRMQVDEIVINNEKILRVYHRVRHYWGAVFYFKNYRPISGTLFYLETLFDKKTGYKSKGNISG